MDLDALRKQTLGAGSDEAVTVNTRALIDKVLARYSGEWTTLRELLQNAADAAAKKVTIRLKTIPSISTPTPNSTDPSVTLRHVLLHHTLQSLTIENDGDHFRPLDWARLKKIAEGNPDETKIGAFGVGFYSVFADCEEPFVSSGDEALAFYWRGDSLFTKKLKLQGQSTPTTFVLPMRNTTSPLPSLLSLCQFLAGSMTFVGLHGIELYLDDWKILHLDKKSAPSSIIRPEKGLNLKTPEGLLHLSEITKEAAQLTATWLKAMEWNREKPPNLQDRESQLGKGKTPSQSFRGFLSKFTTGSSNAVTVKLAQQEQEIQSAIAGDLLGEGNASLFLHVNRATLKSSVPPKFSAELERATKKPPPKSTTVSLLFTSYDEHLASQGSLENGPSSMSKIFQNVLPSRGKVFIGFPTNQTTGIGAHLSTPSIIPTVEREAIDLNNRFIKTWNIELLKAAGIATRISWDEQIAQLKQKLQRNSSTDGDASMVNNAVTKLLSEALFLLENFSWNETTPASQVGTILEEAFWNCSRTMALDILSSNGVLPASKVRLALDELEFVDGIPTLPKALVATGLVQRLVDHGIITEVTVSDINSQLEAKALTPVQLESFLKWVCHKLNVNEIDKGTAQSLLHVTVANDDERGLIQLGSVQTYLNSSRIPPHLPVPYTTLPFRYSQNLKKSDMDALGWGDLQLVPWLRFLIEQEENLPNGHKLTTSLGFARSVLPVVSKQWDGLSASSKTTIIDLLSSHPTIPTISGMRRPSEAYFASVKIFDDLPVVVPLNSVKDKVLATLGVRKTVELGVIFDRLMRRQDGDGASVMDQGETEAQTHLVKKSIAKDNAWNHVRLIQYLVSVRKDIPPADIKRLKETPISPSEDDKSNDYRNLHLISSLFEPDDVLRRLGLPILYWPDNYRSGSDESMFLMLLGLKSAPSHKQLVGIMASADTHDNTQLAERALRYFVDQYQLKGYAASVNEFLEVPFLPLQGSNKRLSSPLQCFTNERAALLGFEILREDLHQHASKFGVNHHPSIIECSRRLINKPPQTQREARAIFEYFAERSADINKDLATTLGDQPIVPISQRVNLNREKASSSLSVKHLPPNTCFLGDGEQWADVFDYVDFGKQANLFLLNCGAKHEPSTIELATKVTREPARLYSLLDAPRYIDLLRKLSGSWQTLKKNKPLVADMRKAPFLFAYREVGSGKVDHLEQDDEEDATVRAGELSSANRIIVIDDTISYGQFKEHLLAAPMEETLEDFYLALGSQLLTDVVDEQHKVGSAVQDQRPAEKLHKLIIERARLFLHDHPRDEIRHDAKWMEKNLRVVTVSHLALRKSLKNTNISYKFSRKAAVSYDRQQGNVLYVTPGAVDFFEISQGLVTLLLSRSKPQSVMMLEMLLETDLVKLRRKGYNVDRILRQKAAEARIAEEQRKQALEREQEELRQQAIQYQEHESERAREQSMVPGSFPGPTDHKANGHVATAPTPGPDHHDQPNDSEPRGLFSQLRRNLGIDRPSRNTPRNSERTIDRTPSIDPPPPYSQEDIHRPPQPEHATAPHQLQQNLISAIQSSHPHHSSSLTSQPTYNEVKETHSYCDATPGTNITAVGETSNPPGARVFLSSTLLQPPFNYTSSKFMSANASALNLFAQVLFESAEVFTLSRSSVHIFYDATGSTIAFNQNKSLFFNFRYFQDLHLASLQQNKKANALIYWSITMAHELAHNIVGDHSAAHSFYMEAMIAQYFEKLSVKTRGNFDASAAPAALVPHGDEREKRLVDVD